jgi:hypothetical protein
VKGKWERACRGSELVNPDSEAVVVVLHEHAARVLLRGFEVGR